MFRPALEVADILRDFGPCMARRQRGHLSLGCISTATKAGSSDAMPTADNWDDRNSDLLMSD